LSAAELEHLYQRGYFFGDEYLDYQEDKPYLQRNFSARLKTLRRFSSGGNLFEIGCAYGYFLELAAKTWQAEGCDISAGACRDARSRGLNAQKPGRLRGATFLPGPAGMRAAEGSMRLRGTF